MEAAISQPLLFGRIQGFALIHDPKCAMADMLNGLFCFAVGIAGVGGYNPPLKALAHTFIPQSFKDSARLWFT